MKVLVIGGTAHGRQLATQLHKLDYDVCYSIANSVRKAQLPCPVIAGGFTQFGGLQQYILDQQITYVVDATDPFAQKMSDKISIVSKALSLPSIRLQYPHWRETEADKWIAVTHWFEAINHAAQYENLLISAGQLKQEVLEQLACSATHILIRTAMPIKAQLPRNVSWLKAVGPFTLETEIKLLNKYKIDAIISKNSGGLSTYAKIQAAAHLSIPVIQFSRPVLLAIDYEVNDIVDCVELLSTFREQFRTH